VDERAPTLLVVEDAEDQAILVGVAARNAHPGLEVHVVEDGQKGIDFLSGIAALSDPPTSPTPDLVVLDLDMPSVDGFGVLQWIQDTFAKPPFPVVVLTATLDPEREKRARQLGATDIYEKPTDLDSLEPTVRHIVTSWISPGDMIAAHMRHAF
jgi:CheY-like chemotaxis protein